MYHAAFRFVPFVVETCGYIGKEAVQFVNRLGDIAAASESGHSQGCICALGNAAAIDDRAEGECRYVPPESADHLA